MPETEAPPPYGRTGWVAVLNDGRRINVECWHEVHGAALLVNAAAGRLVQAVSVPGFVRLARTAPTEMSL
jgi:hypothetical protein